MARTHVLNVKLLLWLVLGAGLLVAVTHVLHLIQVDRTSEALAKSAEEALAKDDYTRADLYLSRYLAFRPDDTVRLVPFTLRRDDLLLRDDRATTPRAISRSVIMFSRILRRDDLTPEDIAASSGILERYNISDLGSLNLELRKRLARAHFALGQVEDVRKALVPEENEGEEGPAQPDARTSPLLVLKPEDPELWRLSARCCLVLAEQSQDAAEVIALRREAAEAYRHAIQYSPNDLSAYDPYEQTGYTANVYEELASLYQTYPAAHAPVDAVDPDNADATDGADEGALAPDAVKTPDPEAVQIIADMRKANPESGQAHLAAYRYYAQFSSMADDAKQALQNAVECGPNDRDVLLAAASDALTEAARAPANEEMPDELLKRAEHFILTGKKEFTRPDEVWQFHVLAVQLALTRGDADAAREEDKRAKPTRPQDQWLMHRELAIAYLEHERFEDAAAHANELDDRGNGEVQLLRGRVAMLRGNLSEAIESFEAMRGLAANNASLASARYYLGYCYEQLQQPDAAMARYLEAVDRSNDWEVPLPHVALARLYAKYGNYAEALRMFRRAAGYPGFPEEAKADMLRTAILQQQARAVEENGDVEPAEGVANDELLKQADKAFAALVPGIGVDAVEDPRIRSIKAIYCASYFATFKRFDAAVDQLERAIAADPENTELPLVLAGFCRQEGDPAALQKSETILREAVERNQSSVLRVELAKLLVGQDRFADAEEILTRDLDGLPKQTQAALLQTWWQLTERRADDAQEKAQAETPGSPEAAEATEKAAELKAAAEKAYAAATKAYGEWSKEDPTVIEPVLVLVDMAIRDGDIEAVEEFEGRLEALEGPEGTASKWCRALRMMQDASGENKVARLAEARRLVNEILQQRPQWAAAMRLLGDLERLQGNTKGAIAAYQQQLNFPMIDPVATKRLVSLLRIEGRDAEVKPALEKLKHARVSLRDQDASFRRSAAISLANLGDTKQALDTLNESSGDALDLLAKAAILENAKRYDEAREAYEKATDRAAQLSDAWIGLIRHHWNQGDAEEAREALRNADEQLAGPDRWVTLARCSHVIEDDERAKDYIEKGLNETKDPKTGKSRDPVLLRYAGMFYLQQGGEEGQRKGIEHLEHARELFEGRDEIAAAGVRRLMAIVLVGKNPTEAFHLIDKNLAQSNGAMQRAADLRVKAFLLTANGGRKDAIRILEDLRDMPNVDAADRFLLAKLYHAEGRRADARDEMLLALGEDGDNTEYLAAYVEMLLASEKFVEADARLSQLEAQKPPPEESEAARTARLARTALLRASYLDDIGQRNEALQLVQRMEGPARERALWLAEHQHVADALEMVKPMATKGSGENRIQALDTALTVLMKGAPTPGQIETVATWIEQATAEDPDNTELRIIQGNTWIVQGRYEFAYQLFRQLLDSHKDKSDATDKQVRLIGLNNLAWILSEGLGQPDKALPYISLAIDEFGPIADLLDTRAVVLTRRGDGDSLKLAILDLNRSIEHDPRPAFYYHLARAQRANGAIEEARASLEKVRLAGGAEQIPVTEREQYVELVTTLEAAGLN